MTSSGVLINQIWQYFQRYQQYINTGIVALLAIYLIAIVANFTWRLIPEPEQAGNQAQSSNSNNSRNSSRQQTTVNIENIKRLNLFGNTTEEPIKVAPVVQDAPQTQLNLVLTGVVTSTEEQEGSAIIDYQGTQVVYGIGDKVEGTNASVQEVFVDRIFIRNGSRVETLMLDGVEFNKLASNQIAGAKIEPPSLKDVPKQLQGFRSPVSNETLAEMRKKPEQFADFIKISPLRESGDLVGYRVNPGKNTSLFSAAGLRANDLVTEINGLDLRDVGQAIQAMEVLRKSKRMEIKVLRDGIEESLYLKLPGSEED